MNLDALMIIANAYDKIGDLRKQALRDRDQLLKILNLALERLGLIENYEHQIEILLQIESLYSDYYRALEIIEQVKGFLPFVEYGKSRTEILRQVAHIYINIGRCDQAQLTLLKRLEDCRKSGRGLINLAEDFALAGLSKKFFLKQALEYAQYETCDYEDRIDLLISVGMSYAELGLHRKAMEIDSIIYDYYGDDWTLQPTLAAELIAYYVHGEEKQYFKVNNILKEYVDVYRFEEICTTAANCYIKEKDFERAWEVVEFLEKRGSIPPVEIAQSYFNVEREEKALYLLEKATNIANAMNSESSKNGLLRKIAQVYLNNNYLEKATSIANAMNSESSKNGLLRKIAQVYLDNNYQDIATQILPKNVFSIEFDRYGRYVVNDKRRNYNFENPIVLKAYSLVENSKYDEALDFLESFDERVSFRARGNLLKYISEQYDCYIALGYRKKAAELTQHKIKLIISRIQRIINQDLTAKTNLHTLNHYINLLIRTYMIYFEENDNYVEKQQILQQMKEVKLACQALSMQNEMMPIYGYSGLVKFLYENYLATKNYQEALLMKEEIVDDFDRVKFLAELAVKISQAT